MIYMISNTSPTGVEYYTDLTPCDIYSTLQKTWENVDPHSTGWCTITLVFCYFYAIHTKWGQLCTPLLWENKDPSTLHSHSYGCWWSGDARIQGIRNQPSWHWHCYPGISQFQHHNCYVFTALWRNYCRFDNTDWNWGFNHLLHCID